MSDPWASTLDAPSIKKAREELHEIAEDREAAVQALREWIEQQPHFTCKTDTFSLLPILRGSKFSQLRAREMVEGQLKMFQEHPKWFRNIDPTDNKIQTIIDRGYAVPLPKRDKNGCRILLYRIGALEPESTEYSHADTIRMAIVMGFRMARDEMTQVNGHVFLFDFTGVTMKHITSSMMQDDMKKWHKVWQKNMPGRFKAFHYYNAGLVFEAMMALFKPFLDKKYQERIIVHDTLESLYKHIGKDLLPEEYLPDDYKGPCIGSIQKLVGDFKRSIDDKEFQEFITDRTSGRYGVDESKRPKNQQVPSTMFRKLNVD